MTRNCYAAPCCVLVRWPFCTPLQQKARNGRSPWYHSESLLSSSSSFKLVSSSNLKRGSGKGASTALTPLAGALEFGLLAAPVNAWSEPFVSMLRVYSSSYAVDGIKVGSGPSLFLAVGVDSFARPSFY